MSNIQIAKVYNRRTDTIPKGTMYIGRPSPWGNQTTVGELKRLYPEASDREIYKMAVNMFRLYAIDRLKREPSWLKPLKGKSLVCWCKPLPCHGDVLLELANRKEI
jgi:hypothetical protein